MTTATAHQPRRRRLDSESGFTIIEFMIAAAITAAVMGSTVALATQIQQSYSTQLEDATVEQEARYALDWIARDLRSATSSPYGVPAADQGVWLDPNGGADDDDSIQVQADIAPPDGALDDPGENLTIALVAGVITREDPNNLVDPGPVAMTDSIFTDLQFTYLNSSREVTDNPELVAFIQVRVTAQSRVVSPVTQTRTTSTLATEVRLRAR